MQNARDYHIYFLRVSSGATYYEKGIERQNDAITCRIQNNFNFSHGNILQSNNDSTK